MRKGSFFYIHSITGLLSGIFIFLLSLSGAILVFHEELERFSYPDFSLDVNKAPLSIDSCYTILQKNYHGAQVSHCNLPERKADPFVFTIYDSSFNNGTEPIRVFLHPQQGTILKTMSARHNFLNWIAIMHNSFHLGKPGEWLFGFFALTFLVSLMTGLILYRKSILAVLTFRTKIFKRKNLHQMVGVFALLFNMMIAVTGFWMQRYVFKKDFYKSTNYTPVLKRSPALFFSLDHSIKNIQSQFPAFTGYVIYFAQTKKGMTTVYGSQSINSFIHSKKFADVIFIDSSGGIAKTAFVNEIDPSSRYDIINSQVHFGQYGGLPVKIVYSLLGLSGGLLSITGFFLWIKRKKRSRLNLVRP